MKLRIIEYLLLMIFVSIVNWYAVITRGYHAFGGEDVLTIVTIAYILYDYRKMLKEMNK